MEIKERYLKLLKLNFEYLIALIELSENITGIKDTLLKNRALDIISTSLSECLTNKTPDNFKWLRESINTYTRYYPENVIDYKFIFLNDQMDMIYYEIIKINDALYKLNNESPS